MELNCVESDSGVMALKKDSHPQEPQVKVTSFTMSPSAPPHLHIRGEDNTTEIDACTSGLHGGGSGKSGRGFHYSISSASGAGGLSTADSSMPSIWERAQAYLIMKSQLIGSTSGQCVLIIIGLVVMLLLALAALGTHALIQSMFVVVREQVRSVHCTPLRVTLCQKYNVGYAYTTLTEEEQEALNERLAANYQTLLSIKCYALLPLFLCAQMAPKCSISSLNSLDSVDSYRQITSESRAVRAGATATQVPLCQEVCNQSIYRCEFFLNIFDTDWPQPQMNCDQLPNSQDPDLCVGNLQLQQLSQTAMRHSCQNQGFRCDSARCIPSSWRCDGYMDCKDETDERDCSNCFLNQFHCGAGVCINREAICDGKHDCPDGRDERQCFRLSDSMGAAQGNGRFQVWNLGANHWTPVCGDRWAVPEQSNEACKLLGYVSSNETRIQADLTESSNDDYHSPKTTTFSLETRSFYDKCQDTSVTIKCQDFRCGRVADWAKMARAKRHRAPRIVGGEESSPGAWPWLVAFHGGPAEVFFCAGVLINERWILTAAHCVGKYGNTTGWIVQLGVTRRTSTPTFVRRRKVRALIKHPGFQISPDHFYSDDIALALLDEPVDFDEFLRPVCLPSAGESVPAGTQCSVIGWGKKVHDHYADYQAAIHEVEVPIVGQRKCIAWYAKQLPFHPILDTMICAGYEQGKKDACQGDSGGPLLCRIGPDSPWSVFGIVSWGINCAQPQLPGIYSNVPMYLDWIANITSSYDY